MNVHKIRRILFFSVFLVGWSLAASAAELTIRLEEPPPSGNVAFVLFDSAYTFGDLRDPAMVVKLPLDGRDVYHIEKIVPGEYVLLVYFDENNNDRIDRNFIGIPKEPLSFSNNYQPKGPPSYSRAAFILGQDESRHFDVKLVRPLGEFGRFGVGLGVIARSSQSRLRRQCVSGDPGDYIQR